MNRRYLLKMLAALPVAGPAVLKCLGEELPPKNNGWIRVRSHKNTVNLVEVGYCSACCSILEGEPVILEDDLKITLQGKELRLEAPDMFRWVDLELTNAGPGCDINYSTTSRPSGVSGSILVGQRAVTVVNIDADSVRRSDEFITQFSEVIKGITSRGNWVITP